MGHFEPFLAIFDHFGPFGWEAVAPSGAGLALKRWGFHDQITYNILNRNYLLRKRKMKINVRSKSKKYINFFTDPSPE